MRSKRQVESFMVSCVGRFCLASEVDFTCLGLILIFMRMAFTERVGADTKCSGLDLPSRVVRRLEFGSVLILEFRRSACMHGYYNII